LFGAFLQAIFVTKSQLKAVLESEEE